jgi:nucleoside-diphosphate-sugar epimerase
MYIILGATGHIGSQLSKLLIEKGRDVIGITHNPKNRETIEEMGAKADVVDVKQLPLWKNSHRQATTIGV